MWQPRAAIAFTHRSSTTDAELRDVLEQVIDKGIVIDPASQLELLWENGGLKHRLWVVNDAPLPLGPRQLR